MAEAVPLELFKYFVELNSAIELNVPDFSKRSQLSKITSEVARRLSSDPIERVIDALPTVIGQAMEQFGWFWNGFYVLGDDGNLHLGSAFGPAVCSTLIREGGLFTSGMCFDCIETNHTLAAYNVRAWPGYVSCDPHSGYQTKAAISCPIRNHDNQPIAVWDMDSTQQIEKGEIRFLDVLMSTLAKTIPLEAIHFVGDGKVPGISSASRIAESETPG